MSEWVSEWWIRGHKTSFIFSKLDPHLDFEGFNTIIQEDRKYAQHVALYSAGRPGANCDNRTLGLITYIRPSGLALTHWDTVSVQATDKIVSVIHAVRPSAALSHAWLTAAWSTRNEDSLLCDASHEIQSSLHYCLHKFVIQHFLVVRFSPSECSICIAVLFLSFHVGGTFVGRN